MTRARTQDFEYAKRKPDENIDQMEEIVKKTLQRLRQVANTSVFKSSSLGIARRGTGSSDNG